MVTSARQFETLSDLRDYVANVLCCNDEIEADRFPMTERLLVRGNQPCGLSFCVHGPRSVKLTAIFDALVGEILFYGATGERFQRTTVLAAPDLSETLAE